MPKVIPIDWKKMPQPAMTKRQFKMAMRQEKAKRRITEAAKETAFQPVLPNRDKYKLQHELSILNTQIKDMKNRQREIVRDIKEIDKRTREHKLQPVSLYALELENGYYYIGMSFNVDRRFRQHTKGKGAAWTKLHKPVQILETRLTTFYDQDEVAKLEDDMTLEYALKFGSNYVRGGGYCQTKPYWPEIIKQNELIRR